MTSPPGPLQVACARRAIHVLAALGAISIWMHIVAALLAGGVPTEPSALPVYQLEVSSTGDPPSEATGVARLNGHDSLTFVLRPFEAVTGPIEVQSFVERAGSMVRWPVRFERLAAGVFALPARLRDFLPLDGQRRFRLQFLVGRPASPASWWDSVALLRGPRQASQEPWQRLSAVVEVADEF